MVYIKSKTNSLFRLFCFPYAGGSSSFFYRWAQSLPKQVEICPVHLPGRANRLNEEPFTKMESLVESIAQSIQAHIDVPFAFFGHSMGAMVCFELSQYLLQHQHPTPVKLFVSGCRAPNIVRTEPAIYHLPTDDFLKELKGLGGTPSEVLDNVEIMEILMPALRADFELIETYRYPMHQPLPLPITAFGGIDDVQVESEHLRAWEYHTTKNFELKMLPGNHFFLHEQQDRLLKLLKQELEQICSKSGAFSTRLANVRSANS